MPFLDRSDAGRRLAQRLMYLHGADPIVLGLPRGGVPVAFEVARALQCPLDVIVVRKLGVPFQPELAMGAVGEDGIRVVDDRVVRQAGVTPADFTAVEQAERRELERRVQYYRRGRPGIEVAGRTVIVVDDGIATGSTARAACRVASARGADRVVLAAPIAPPSVIVDLGLEVEMVCVQTSSHMQAVGEWYKDFAQTTDEEVLSLLDRVAMDPTPTPAAGSPDDLCLGHRRIEVPAGRIRLPGNLTVPERCIGAVLFAHGSGSSRHSPRNRFVAEALNRSGLATLLFDLLTPSEETDRGKVFDIGLLADRLTVATDWLRTQPECQPPLPVGYFGASTGAGAALWAAADPDADVAAIVSRGGRPDLAEARLMQVRAPTLLIVGERDTAVLDLNRRAQAHMLCENRLETIPAATHLFTEPGTLEAVADRARVWLTDHFVPVAESARRL